MCYGLSTVFLFAVMFGIVGGWWNRIASERNSEFGILIYSSGFFAAAIAMRSMMVFTTAIIPTVFAVIFGVIFLRIRNTATSRPDRRTRKSVGVA
jgi:hypothetical protein